MLLLELFPLAPQQNDSTDQSACIGLQGIRLMWASLPFLDLSLVHDANIKNIRSILAKKHRWSWTSSDSNARMTHLVGLSHGTSLAH
jgi:hypothetical protein